MHSTGSSTSRPPVTAPVIASATNEPTGIIKPEIAVDPAISFSANHELAIKLIEFNTSVIDVTEMNVPRNKSQN